MKHEPVPVFFVPVFLGHDLESKIIQKWPQINGITHGRGEEYFKNYLLDNVIAEFPQYIAQEIKELFEKYV